MREKTVRFYLPDDPADRFAEFEVGHNGAIGETEEMQLGNAQYLCGAGLFLPPDLCHARARNRVVEPAGLAVGYEAVDHAMALVGEGGGGSGAAEIKIIRVGGDIKNGERTGHLLNDRGPTRCREKSAPAMTELLG